MPHNFSASKMTSALEESSWSIEIKQYKLGARLKARAEEKRKRDRLVDMDTIKAKIEEICGKVADEEGCFGTSILLEELDIHDSQLEATAQKILEFLRQEGVVAELACKNAETWLHSEPCEFGTCHDPPDRIVISWL